MASVSSVLVHLLLGAVAVWSLMPLPQRDYAPVTILVTLRPATIAPPVVRRSLPHRRQAKPASTPKAEPVVAPHLPANHPLQAGTPPSRAVADGGTDQQALRNALRGLIGCRDSELAEMTEAARDQCRRRFASRGHGIPIVAVHAANPSTDAALRREVHTNEVWQAYKHSRRMDDWPGWANIFGRDGRSLDPPAK